MGKLVLVSGGWFYWMAALRARVFYISSGYHRCLVKSVNLLAMALKILDASPRKIPKTAKERPWGCV
ncbi:MAG: hypothetical protein A2508_02165 [Candidatus Lambdaproteobacteria bacterium RIFOXYD12_FULL_49_8]|uniref:Uncharacterized protein n=1 Tax=Candidatus Lambdaproteobacteria bacterium RIFOXYD2_FULL_50_16 TaxID=1817772 RepID=A0A1F6GEK3_9PROT|nr:MAG: hypothetical protein A2527_01225 [Candidatus Lambdaproteobacteria bacterium RIFOXYD2_FULL_50_16]OGG97812.1 MAG: hypothetical protein A2508_02165 [Candidatus Lambdaproteobacteria bacterium RIFOXYD12_FULL_49_8]